MPLPTRIAAIDSESEYTIPKILGRNGAARSEPWYTVESMVGPNVELVEAYLDELRGVRRLSPNTIESYHRDLGGLLRFAERRRIATLTRSDLEAFVRQLMEAGLSPRSVARAVACVRGFFRFLVRDGHLRQDPAGELRAPRAWPSLPKFLSVDQVDQLLEEPDTSTAIGLRDRALLELLYATGMRVSELVSVKPADLNLKAGYLTCMGKGSKERLVPIGRPAVKWIRGYTQTSRPALAASDSPWLFVNARGGHLSRVGFWKILKKYGKQAGLPLPVESPRPAPFVCHPPPRSGRRSAFDPEPVRSRRPLDDPNLYSYPRGASEGSLRRVSPALVAAREGGAWQGALD